MAAIQSIPSLYSISRCSSSVTCNSSSSFAPPLRFLRFQRSSVVNKCSLCPMINKSSESRRIMSVAEDTVIPEAEVKEDAEEAKEEAEEVKEEAPADQPVSVPVSPSDILTMLFQAEGTMAESNVPTVSKALEVIEGVRDLKVQVVEGIASVELSKQTTVQATGVASNLVEIIQGTGFKLQTLNLSFEDEEDNVA